MFDEAKRFVTTCSTLRQIASRDFILHPILPSLTAWDALRLAERSLGFPQRL